MSSHHKDPQLKQLTDKLNELLAEDSPHSQLAHQLVQSMSREIRHLTNDLEHRAYNQVKLSRHPKRPTSMDLIPNIFHSFLELHGDRCYGDDTAMITGVGFLREHPVTIIAQQKGHNLEENLHRNFGMSHPEGYRKAKRAMEQAERFGRPVISFIDTPGAYPGIGAEERGQAEAIASNLYRMSTLAVPIVGVVIGEGGSGGALGIGVVDHLIMLSNAIYSVISPEGCAAILWKDAGRAADAAEALRLTAMELKKLGIVDSIVPEPQDGAHLAPAETAEALKNQLEQVIDELLQIPPIRLLKTREEKYRRIGLSDKP